MPSCSPYPSAESLYLQGIVNFGSKPEIPFSILKKKVEKDPYNCCHFHAVHLAVCYMHGLGTKRSLATASSLLSLASDKGSASASYLLALIYKTLLNNTDYAKLYYQDYLRKAADLGHPIAQMDLGDYYTSLGNPIDTRRGNLYYAKAAEQGYPPARKALSA